MSKKTVMVTVGDVSKEYPAGTVFETVAKDFQKDYDAPIILASANGKLRELNKKITSDCKVDFNTRKGVAGHKTYRRTATFVLIKAIRDIVGQEALEKIKVEFSLGKGIYVNILGKVKVDREFLDKVKERMDELIAADLPIVKESFDLDDAIKLFREEGMRDKERLFKYRRASKVNVYSLDGFYDYYYGYMCPSTGYIKKYDLFPYDEGFVIQLSSRKDPDVLPEFKPQDKLYKTMKESTQWGISLDIETVGALNDKICAGKVEDLVLVSEALQEAKISEIAQDIANRKGVKFIMIAGPSSSGKTSFSHRLSIQLRAKGLVPHPIALDNYFKNREDTPRDENGKYDFECLGAMDVEGFNNDMRKLLAGETVELPSFNFKIGQREYKGDYMQLNSEDVLVLEGIHGLNEKMSYALPAESKYKIYISALTSLNVDEHNRISTTDTRLLRRMVRDNRTRGTSASGTLAMWQSVRRGEEENIFPFQESADAMFNSALIYELAVLKQFAEPLLFAIEKDDPEYLEAKRLLKFLDYFVSFTCEDVPKNSLMREFIGGSIFNV
ncbi:MAG: nucleoside kinase [Lachnospiraceae bacterium]|nr:nucleoside kinase [Lachnospiraceae bacterium]